MGNVGMKNLGRQAGISVARFIRRIQEMYERISDTEATLGEINSSVKENVLSKNHLSQKMKKNQDSSKNSDIRLLGMKEEKETKTKTQTIFSTKA